MGCVVRDVIGDLWDEKGRCDSINRTWAEKKKAALGCVALIRVALKLEAGEGSGARGQFEARMRLNMRCAHSSSPLIW
jgi:hypothetical protein